MYIAIYVVLKQRYTKEAFYEFLKPLCMELHDPIHRYLLSLYELPEDANDLIAVSCYADAYAEAQPVPAIILKDIYRSYHDRSPKMV